MIRLEGAEVLCNSLRTNRVLTNLDLSYNALGNAAGVLGAALIENNVSSCMGVFDFVFEIVYRVFYGVVVLLSHCLSTTPIHSISLLPISFRPLDFGGIECGQQCHRRIWLFYPHGGCARKQVFAQPCAGWQPTRRAGRFRYNSLECLFSLHSFMYDVTLLT